MELLLTVIINIIIMCAGLRLAVAFCGMAYDIVTLDLSRRVEWPFRR